MSHTTLASAVGFALFASALPSHAHHSFAAEFDATKPLKMTGTVTKVEWQNPHSWFYIDVKDEGGNITNWGWELASPNLLMRNGWTPTTLKAGDEVSVDGFQSRDDRKVANARGIVLMATGRTLLGGSSRSGEGQ
jgi:hypothetical protein